MNRIRTVLAAATVAVCTGVAGTPALASSTDMRPFCTAVTRWGLSPAVRELQIAVRQGDKLAMAHAFRDWTDETRAMAEALPPDAPSRVEQGFANLSEAIDTLAEGRTVSKRLLKTYRQSRGAVLRYFRATCT